MTEATQHDSPIERYLDDLQTRLWLPPQRIRRVLAEAEDHLRESAAEHERTGLDAIEAESRAVAGFGSARDVAQRFAREEGLGISPSLIAELVIAGALLVGVGFVAIGLSGLLAEAMGAAFGHAFVAGDAPGVTYTAERCGEYLHLFPANANLTCTQAALEDHFGEVTMFREMAGVLGLFALAGAWALRRAYRGRVAVRLLSTSLTPAIGAAAFGGASALLMGTGLMELTFRPDGSGALLSAGIVSLAMFAVYSAGVVRALRTA